MAHSVSGYVLYISMWFNTKFVRVPKSLLVRGFLFFCEIRRADFAGLSKFSERIFARSLI